VWLQSPPPTVGNSGEFVGSALRQDLERLDLPARGREHGSLHGVATVGKLALACGWRSSSNGIFAGKRLSGVNLLPFIVPTVLSTFAWKWMFDRPSAC